MSRPQMLLFNDALYSNINLRFPLSTYQLPKSLRKNFKKNTERFSVKVGVFNLRSEFDELWREHQKRFVNSGIENLQDYFECHYINRFDTFQIEVYDQNRLVALSFLDIGENSMMSLLGLFAVDYQQYSLGLFTMTIELTMAKQLPLAYYYPGYVLDKPSVFDYKFRLGVNCERFDWHSATWKPYNREYFPTMASLTVSQSEALAEALTRYEIGFARRWYQFYTWPYQPSLLMGPSMVFCPILFVLGVRIGKNGRHKNWLMVAYSAENQCFILMWVYNYIRLENNPDAQKRSANERNPMLYYTNPLGINKIVLESSDIGTIMKRIQKIRNTDALFKGLLFEKNEVGF